VASVFELSEPYRNFLVSVLPPGRGVCATCWRAVDPEYRLCYPCRTAQYAFGRRLADVVVPVALAVKRLDDTWTTGSRAQSAAIALHDAGAAKVAVVVLGRHFDRGFGSGETYYQQAKARAFTWDACCLEMDPPVGTTSA
jgi:hypothetical protein